jgi:hypothetical protein
VQDAQMMLGMIFNLVFKFSDRSRTPCFDPTQAARINGAMLSCLSSSGCSSKKFQILEKSHEILPHLASVLKHPEPASARSG